MNSFGDFFKSKNALVVGGSGGIGKEISLALSEAGANVTVHGGHNSEKINSLIKKMNSVSNPSQKHSAIILDFTKIDLENLFAVSTPLPLSEQSALEKNASIESFSSEQHSTLNFQFSIDQADILCLCYGPFLQKKIEETTSREWLEMAKLNLALPGILAGRAASFMKKRGFGRILFFGGTRTNQINGFATNAAYGAAKTGIASLAKSFALEYGKHGISTAAIFPGFVQTEYVSSEQEKYYKNLLGSEMISPKSIAQKALFLFSAPDFNGTLLEVDRGWTPEKL